MNTLEVSSSLMKNVMIITRMRGMDKSLQNSKNIKLSTNLNDSKSGLNKSKTFQLKNNKSAPKLINNKIKDNIKYTMFTSGDSSNIMLVSKKPIKGSTINEALKVCNNLYDFHNSILNETSLLEYDKIYNETHSIDKIYNEIIKDNLSQLFHKKNSSVFFFGPSSGGKSYLLIGEKEDENNTISNYQKINYNKKYNTNKTETNKKIEGGLLRRSVNNILNLIKINKQGNDNSSNIQNKYELIFSAYEVYMDKIYDLLSKEINNISIEKYYDEEQNLNINLANLTNTEIRSIQDYEKILKEISLNQNNLSKILKIKNLSKKSHIVISLKLQKKIQNTVGSNITDNYSINSFSQIDFIELVASEIGLSDKFDDKNDLSNEYKLYINTKDIYNSICDNIVCANNGTTPNKESILTFSLKNTLKTNSNIIFFNCIIPWEFPVNHSFKALKFATWLRNQVINEVENMNTNNSSVNNLPNMKDNINNNLYNSINENNNRMYPNTNNSYLINNYQNPIAQDNSYINHYQNYSNINKTFPEINNLIGQSMDNGNSKTNILINEEQNDGENNNFNIKEEQNIKLIRSRSGKLNLNNKSYDFPNNQNLSYFRNNNNSQVMENNINNKSQYVNNLNNQNLSQNEKTLLTLEQTLKELEEKKLEIENKMLEEKNKNYNTYNMNNNINNNMNNMNVPIQNKLMNRDALRLKEEQDILKSDNIIMREDISRLSETNQNLENEIAQNRELISQLQSENQKLSEENNLLKTKLNDYDNQNYSQLYINGQISKEDFLQKNFNERYLLQNKLKDLENNYNSIQKEKMQYEVDYKVLLSKYNEIKEKYDKCNFELINNKQIHDNELYNIDNKINDLSKKVEMLQMENSELRKENEKQRNSLNIMMGERDKYMEKYEEKKFENDLLNKKIYEVENGFSEMMKEKEYEKNYRRQKEENHKNRNDTKNKIAMELQSKIQQYRRERLYKNNNNEDFI